MPFRRGAHTYDDRYAVAVDSADRSRFGAALRRELRLCARRYASEEPLRTLYLGGGRPSLLSLQHLHTFRDALQETLDLSAVEEVTLEANPADVDRDYARGLRKMGIDRVSLEALAFSAPALEAVEAPHTEEDVARALRVLRSVGPGSVSLTLLFGWPEQSQADWTRTLARAITMGLPHLTVVEASPETGRAASETARARRLQHAMSILESEGYAQYELTHFARPGARSHHQTRYYAHENQLALGPSSESFWWGRRDAHARARRWTNVNDLDRYMEFLREQCPPVAHRQSLNRTALAQEYVMLRLRTAAGLDLRRLREQYGVDLRTDEDTLLDRLRAEDLIRTEDHTVRLSSRGRLLADAITEKLMPSR
ncbi:MAG: coproporphyrinogen-III oxidase family protein [Salinibacter sp.]